MEGSHGWYRTVEDSSMRDMRYIFVKNQHLAAGACCYVYLEKMHYLTLPLVDVKSFLFKTPDQALMLLQGLQRIQKEENTKGILILDLKREEFDASMSILKGFSEFPMNDDTCLDLPFTSFDEYLDSLNAKSRRSIRVTLNKARKYEIRSLYTNEFSQWKEVAHRLQGYFCEQYNDYRTHLSEAFYQHLEKNLKDNAELMIFFKDKIPLAFGLSLNSDTVSQINLGGADPRYRKYQAYFLIYYQGIKRAIERGQKKIYFGPTTYDFKEKIGCKREKRFGLFRLKNPVLNMGLHSYLKVRGLLKTSTYSKA